MSIWGSWAEIGTDVLTRLTEDENGRPALVKYGRQPKPERGIVLSYPTGWSNHYPDPKRGPEQPANVGVASIPSWCVPGHREDYSESPGPWLRLDVQTAEHDFLSGGKPTGRYDAASVLLDEEAARSLRDDLTDWLDRPKTYPATEPAPSPTVEDK